ncbi:MAG: hypothetical protein Q8T09_00820 [Candidatus Melainabacteria bacterium]|nr:hypothetical protein [Candidatus Melainabacteria bacterium]
MVDQANLNMQELFEKDGLGELPNNAAPVGEWMSVQAASNATQMSMATLRRYMKAKKLKSRRLGRSVNAKVEVFITPDFLPDDLGNSEALNLEDAIDNAVEAEHIDSYFGFDDNDQADQASESTIAWFRQKLDEKDDLIREKDAKIEQLLKELAGASHRNGYLEAEKENFTQRLLLIEDRQSKEAIQPIEEAPVQPAKPEPKGGWSKVASWFSGSQ